MSHTTLTVAEFIKKFLNKEQQKAVSAKEGVFLVVAGAGSGKTRVITTRIAHLIKNEEVAPLSILALTFTNKAAKEMRERIRQFIGHQTDLPFIGTFHAYCLRLLKQYAHLHNTPFLSILDEEDQHKLLNGIIHRNNLTKRTTAKKLSYQISQLKNSSIDPLSDVHHSSWNSSFMREVYLSYEREKRAQHSLDFDDLLLETVKLFKTNAIFKQQFQQRIRHILVDEYQDTNVVQHALLKECCLDERASFSADSLCVVGDEDQSIYSWRGATIANIINFKKDFSQAKTIKIEQNYRSVQPILNLANHVIQHNTERNPKNLWSERPGTDRVRVIACLSEYQEGEIVAQFLKTTQKTSSSPTAILYRAHYQSRALEEALIKQSIPYTIVGGIEFYERKEIKDLLAYLRLMVNPFDRVSFSRVINCPQRGLGEKFEEEFYACWDMEPLFDFKLIAQDLLQRDALTRAKKTALVSFITVFDAVSATDLPSHALDRILSLTAYMAYVKNSYETQEAESRMDNIKELLHAVRYLEEQGISSITQFLDDVALMQDKLSTEEKGENPVLLMTLHAAKGLEFDQVVITGLEEGILPSSRALTENNVEEERRLLYVGITRAKERLLMTHCRYRYTYGQMNTQHESRFVQEMSPDLLACHDGSSRSIVEMQRIFTQWLGITSVPSATSSSVLTFGTAKKAFSEEPAQPKISTVTIWKKNQPVQHKKFGTGIIQMVEKKDDGSIYLTIDFRVGTKKIDAKFVTQV